MPLLTGNTFAVRSELLLLGGKRVAGGWDIPQANMPLARKLVVGAKIRQRRPTKVCCRLCGEANKPTMYAGICSDCIKNA